MSEPKAPTPQAVSLFLAREFKRSLACGPTTTQGFTVRKGLGPPGRVRHVAVEHDPGTRLTRSGTPEGLLKLKQSTLTEYQKHLEQRYRVTTNEDESGEWDTLLVCSKENEGAR